MDSWNKLCIDRLHAQLIYSFSEWTLITDGEMEGFNMIRPEIRLLHGYLCVLRVCACVCVWEKHVLQVFIHTVRPPKHPKEPTSVPVDYV